MPEWHCRMAGKDLRQSTVLLVARTLGIYVRENSSRTYR
jgi:hypothetical protein